MALSRALILAALIATIFSTMAMAKDFVVGDKRGWKLGVDYQSWAANKVFRLGDTLTFNYVGGKDNVVRVNGSDFQSCSIPWRAPVLTSGHDTIVFKTYGRRWYFSGAAHHCNLGQKLFITVQPPHFAWSPVPSTLPSPSPVPAPEATPPSNAPWGASVQTSELTWSPVPSPTPSDEAAPPSNAPWTAPRRSLLPKKLFKIIHRNLMIAV